MSRVAFLGMQSIWARFLIKSLLPHWKGNMQDNILTVSSPVWKREVSRQVSGGIENGICHFESCPCSVKNDKENHSDGQLQQED